MAESDQQERTEDPTQQRREDFRRRGQVAQTKELATVLMLLSLSAVLWFLSRYFFAQMSELFTQTFSGFILEAAKKGDVAPAVAFVAKRGLAVAVPLVGMLSIISLASTFLQVGFLNNEDAMQLDFERINPVNGFKRLLSLKAFLEGLKSLVKLVLVGAVVYFIVRDQILQVPKLIHFSVSQIAAFMGGITLRLLGGIGLFMGIVAAADYFLQRWDLEKQMRMTKQEVKEEHKSREGDPLIKARVRRIQREMANKRMMKDVPKADVIITNPTHIAVAIRYDAATMAAPRVVAKGAGLIAEKIKEIARQHRVPVVENKPLARTIFKTLKIGQSIPRELFTAIAQVLSYVYKLKRKAFN